VIMTIPAVALEPGRREEIYLAAMPKFNPPPKDVPQGQSNPVACPTPCNSLELSMPRKRSMMVKNSVASFGSESRIIQ